MNSKFLIALLLCVLVNLAFTNAKLTCEVLDEDWKCLIVADHCSWTGSSCIAKQLRVAKNVADVDEAETTPNLKSDYGCHYFDKHPAVCDIVTFGIISVTMVNHNLLF
ncbi:hypothetical protein CYY_006857 [Polysphondylium violaceum]|uniref:Uncharacterized protein n=1 Tax=Polysphondylium violaceum TaxID=133409 RepID=A0A8J4UY01_9MYCE|nr:hypothetical protein CYY_006857 [Polysphondylium violaceum]